MSYNIMYILKNYKAVAFYNMFKYYIRPYDITFLLKASIIYENECWRKRR